MYTWHIISIKFKSSAGHIGVTFSVQNAQGKTIHWSTYHLPVLIEQRYESQHGNKSWKKITWLNFCTNDFFFYLQQLQNIRRRSSYVEIEWRSCRRWNRKRGIVTPSLLRSDAFLKPSFWHNTQWAPRNFFPSSIIIFDWRNPPQSKII